MGTDARVAAEFYATPLGAMTAHVLRLRLMAMWPVLEGRSVLGIGYPAPYLRLWREHAARTVAVTPAQIGAARWLPGAAGLSCTAEETALPFADLSFDHVLLVHGLEAAENARGLLREVWRVLKDDGRLLVVAPNRAGLWALGRGRRSGRGIRIRPGRSGGCWGRRCSGSSGGDGAAFSADPAAASAADGGAVGMGRAGRWRRGWRGWC